VTTAWALLSSFERLLSPYGLLLLTKLGGFVGLLGLATMNRYRLTPALAAGRRGAVSGLRRTIGGELAVMLTVLIATAFMTTLYSPD
jgi:putative copper resistance protein D